MIAFYRLAYMMKKRHMNTVQLAQVSGISRATISKMLNGHRIYTDVLGRICEALSCQPGDIMEYIPDSEEKE